MIDDAIRAARVPCPPNSNITATTILGSSCGAKPTNHAWLSSTPFFRFQPKWVAETVEELESEMGLPAGTLVSTVEVYNRHAENGEDPVLGKKAEWCKPIGSPVAALDLRNFTAGFTLGGLRTTLNSEVLHVSGEPIPGLFAAGRCTSGVCAGGYASGTSLGDGSFYGRRAGVAAAKG